MNQVTVPVVPAPYVRPPVTVTNIQVNVMNIILFKSVNISVVLFSNNTYIDTKTYLLTGTDYTSWSNDDTYIINYALTQLGLTAA